MKTEIQTISAPRWPDGWLGALIKAKWNDARAKRAARGKPIKLTSMQELLKQLQDKYAKG